jgi:hypothetical protein
MGVSPVSAITISGNSRKAGSGITRGNGGQEELCVQFFAPVSSDHGGRALEMAHNFTVLPSSGQAVRIAGILPQGLFLTLT